MPPKKQEPKKDSSKPSKLKTAGASGMAQFTVSDADRFQLFLSQVNQPDPVTGNPHPNKVELDRVRREYMDWYTPVDLTDLETAYYGLLFSTGQMFSGANQITKQFEELVDQREPDSFLEFYKLVIMGNWLVKNNRLDVTSYSKLSTALSTIPIGLYVVCKGDVTDMLDLHSSMCYLNDLLNKYDPVEYGTNLLPNDCPALAELPRTQGSIMDEKAAALAAQAAEQARQNNMARAAAVEYARGYAMAAAKPAEPVEVKRHPTQRYTQVRKLTPKEKLKRKIEAGKIKKQEEKAKAAEEAQKLLEDEAKKMEEAEALKEYKAATAANNMSKTVSKRTNNNKLTRSEVRTKKRIAKSIKRAHGADLDNLKLLITRIAANANKKLTDMLLDKYGHLLDDAELIEEYLTSIFSEEDEPEDSASNKAAYDKREHHREVIEDARGLRNILIQSRKTVAGSNTQSSAQPDVVIVRKTPEPANNAPKTIPEAAAVLSNSYETESEEEEADMTGLERPVRHIRQGTVSGPKQPKIRSTKKGNNVSAAKAERAMSSKARNKSKSAKRSTVYTEL